MEISLASWIFQNHIQKKATAIVEGKEFAIRRGGLWKHFLEINSPHQSYNVRTDLNWRSKMEIIDANGNSYVFKRASIWKSKWHWIDRYERPLVEIISKSFSRKNRGLIEIKDPILTDCLFWIIVSWFVVMCSESDAAASAAA